MKDELHLELLIGKRVLGEHGKPIGRLEEIVAEVKGTECLISEYHVGAYATFERLSAWSIGRAILRLFGARNRQKSYRVPWDKLDLGDPDRPQLRCAESELKTLE